MSQLQRMAVVVLYGHDKGHPTEKVALEGLRGRSRRIADAAGVATNQD